MINFIRLSFNCAYGQFWASFWLAAQAGEREGTASRWAHLFVWLFYSYFRIERIGVLNSAAWQKKAFALAYALTPTPTPTHTNTHTHSRVQHA